MKSTRLAILGLVCLAGLAACSSTETVSVHAVSSTVNAVTATSDKLLKGEMVLSPDLVQPNATVLTAAERNAALDTNEMARRHMAEAMKPVPQ